MYSSLLAPPKTTLTLTLTLALEIAGDQAGPLVKYPPPQAPTTEVGQAAAEGNLEQLAAALEAGASTAEAENTVRLWTKDSYSPHKTRRALR